MLKQGDCKDSQDKSGDRVITACMKRVTPQNSFKGEKTALKAAVLFNRFHGIYRAGGDVPATGPCQR